MKGLLCPICKTKLHEVIETRGAMRRRRCFNGHKFSTEERVVNVHRREKLRPQVLKLLAIPKRSPGHKTVKEIAQQLHTSVHTVYRIKRGEIAERQVRKSTLKGTSK